VQSVRNNDGIDLAYDYLPGAHPVVVFCPGFASDMGGTKAVMLRDYCAARGQAMLRLDYAGHGASGGAFEDGTIGGWVRDTVTIIRHAVDDADLILVGSSMGGWIALLIALQWGPRVVGLIGIAAAPDFTEDLIRPAMTPAQRQDIATHGLFHAPSEYGPPTPITARLLDEACAHLLLRGPIALRCPIRLIHGQRDPDVPWQTALHLAAQLDSENVSIILLKDGDHRLSREADLLLIRTVLGELIVQNRR
jgi:pimeloyl-ACP methyl ester carboxylesterase